MTWLAAVPLFAFWVFLVVEFRKPHANRVVLEPMPLQEAMRRYVRAMREMETMIGMALMPAVALMTESFRALGRALGSARE